MQRMLNKTLINLNDLQMKLALIDSYSNSSVSQIKNASLTQSQISGNQSI